MIFIGAYWWLWLSLWAVFLFLTIVLQASIVKGLAFQRNYSPLSGCVFGICLIGAMVSWCLFLLGVIVNLVLLFKA